MSERGAIVWFRHDLRLDDNLALSAAAALEGPVIPVFIWSPEEEAPWQPGAASRWWLHHSLASLAKQLQQAGSRLILRQGPAGEVLQELIDETGANAVFWNRRYEPAVIARDRDVKQNLRDEGLTADSFNSQLLWEPWTISTKQDRPYQVFTPYWKTCLQAEPPAEPEDQPENLPAPDSWPESDELDDLKLLPDIDWDSGLEETWTPGTAAAAETFDRFVEDLAEDYNTARDRPDHQGTSRLSPHLHFGEISVRRIWHTLNDRIDDRRTRFASGAETFLKELGWRDFAHHVLYHFPQTANEPLREKYADFPWRQDETSLRAWQQGQTGYPIVDAGMRELWHTGWMHNRVRMIVASFLTKDLLISWQEGARWFWDTLVDADLANNTLGWQWAGGCGADAAPYFRIFNPTSQAEKHDPEQEYVQHWIPELTAGKTGVRIGKFPKSVRSGSSSPSEYPPPIVDHQEARQRALAALQQIAD
ncbi:MAG: deoxyribodipyrimidine photo-lyase [Planctomycetaceae bacterium]|nr:deoxyribodipyrimidine photo-lyase [Planctomycetaceae bacterium]